MNIYQQALKALIQAIYDAEFTCVGNKGETLWQLNGVTVAIGGRNTD